MIYEKSLRVTNAVKSEMGVGAIVNLQSNDASKIWNTPLYLHIVWNGPFQASEADHMQLRKERVCTLQCAMPRYPCGYAAVQDVSPLLS